MGASIFCLNNLKLKIPRTFTIVSLVPNALIDDHIQGKISINITHIFVPMLVHPTDKHQNHELHAYSFQNLTTVKKGRLHQSK